MKEVVHCELPRIVTYEEVLTDEFCDNIVKQFTESGMNPEAGKESAEQSDGQVHPGIEQRNISWDTPMEIRMQFWKKIEEVAGIPVDWIEAGDIYRYDESQFFALHVDYPINPDRITYYSNGGDRRFTAIFYLNDEYEGGELDFPELGFTIKCKKRSMTLLEYDYEDEAINESSIHESTAITSGEKWICANFISNGKVPK